ncbi:hypothetical protein GCM10007036_45230 [Alsobacter metallidurans]|uniref:DUF2125 domain-containing protein n=1 Tax=Alsobacter metallidurans TaxID=340221 RepID=A0A917IAL7_9HYPH|nr:DUF2125 domain-containing protein [Alsobacter metallidurans]GGH32966.1 hypothetical protein GCM10007036_45230 [Alsobacter metallidurans]
MEQQVRRWSRTKQEPVRRPRPSRLRIFAPSLLLLLCGGAVGAFWTFASWCTAQEIDAWLGREAALGREWSCPDRKIGGFPFRIEVSCAKPTFSGVAEGRAVRGQLAGAVAVAQVYAPSHVIVEAEGPLEVRDETGANLSAAWELLRASLAGKPGAALERISVEGKGLTVVAANAAGSLETGARSLELHLRRTPERPPEDGAFDVAATLNGARIAPLDAMLGGSDATDATVLATVTRAEPLGGHGLKSELDRWREAGGRVQLTSLTLLKGTKRVDAAGSLGLDELHRAQGRIEVTLTGLDELLQSMGVGSRTAAIGGLIASVLGGKKADVEPPPGATGALKGVTLPLRLDAGKAFLGPIPVARLTPVY